MSIYKKIERNWFITVSIALFDLEKSVVKFCRAGHTPLVLIRKNESKLYIPRGIGVGLESGDVFESSIEEIEIKFNSGDLFAIFSDGVNEAMNETKELFGMEKFSDLLVEFNKYPVDQIMNETISSLKEHQGCASPNDDITLVLIKIS